MSRVGAQVLKQWVCVFVFWRGKATPPDSNPRPNDPSSTQWAVYRPTQDLKQCVIAFLVNCKNGAWWESREILYSEYAPTCQENALETVQFKGIMVGQ